MTQHYTTFCTVVDTGRGHAVNISTRVTGPNEIATVFETSGEHRGIAVYERFDSSARVWRSAQPAVPELDRAIRHAIHNARVSTGTGSLRELFEIRDVAESVANLRD